MKKQNVSDKNIKIAKKTRTAQKTAEMKPQVKTAKITHNILATS